MMQEEYDFSQGKRVPVDPNPAGKTRITIRLDDEIIAWFREQAEQAGGGNYQTSMNQALREHIGHQSSRIERAHNNHLVRECNNLDPSIEQAFTERGVQADLSDWPEY